MVCGVGQRGCDGVRDRALSGCGVFELCGGDDGVDVGWSDTGRSPGTSYSYRVRARDAAGNTGAYSSVATAVTPAAVDNPPSAPTGLSASASGSSGVNLSWTAATDDFGCRDVRGGAVSGRGLFGVRAGGDDGVDVVGGHGSGGVDELFVSGAGAGHGQPGGPVFECRLGDDGCGAAAAVVDPGRGVRVRRGIGHDGRRPVGERQRRPDAGRRRGRRRASSEGVDVQRVECAGDGSRMRRRCD